jgi:hypothetical protein
MPSSYRVIVVGVPYTAKKEELIGLEKQEKAKYMASRVCSLCWLPSVQMH